MKDSRQSLIQMVQRYARKQKGPITVAGLERFERLNHRALYQCFPGGFAELLTTAGLADRIARVGRLGLDVLMREFDRVARELGRMPDWAELSRLGRYSTRTYYMKFGRLRDVTAADAKWKEGQKAHPLAVGLGETHAKSAIDVNASGEDSTGSVPATPVSAPVEAAVEAAGAKEADGAPDGEARPSLRGVELVGAPLAFRSLAHAPTTENAVIFLFGLLAPDLGIVVESIGPDFPDCIAMRAQPGSGGGNGGR